MTSRCITIYTDASWCVKTQAGGWACWVKYAADQMPISASGFFRDKVGCSTEAEMKAIANALAIVVKQLQPKDNILVVVTDSAMAIQYISVGVKQPRKGKLKPRWQLKTSLSNDIKKLIPVGCELRLNKVKAHSSSDGRRSYVNNLVDVAAKKAMKQKRKILEKGKS